MIAMRIESAQLKDVLKDQLAAACLATAPEDHDSGWCSLPSVCHLLGIPNIVVETDIRFQRRRVKAGQWLFGSGEKFKAVFIVYAGFLKTVLVDNAGNEQILGFPMKGDLLGIDGLHNEHYASQAVALTDCDLVVIPFPELMSLGHEYTLLESWLYRAVGRELVREHAVVGLLGTLGAEARVARFLVALSERFAAIGYSSASFNLRMTRQEIGSYLGLTLETVSRSLSALDDAGLIHINQRAVEIRDIASLRSLQKIPVTAKAKRPLSVDLPSRMKCNPKHSMWSEISAT